MTNRNGEHMTTSTDATAPATCEPAALLAWHRRLIEAAPTEGVEYLDAAGILTGVIREARDVRTSEARDLVALAVSSLTDCLRSNPTTLAGRVYQFKPARSWADHLRLTNEQDYHPDDALDVAPPVAPRAARRRSPRQPVKS